MAIERIADVQVAYDAGRFWTGIMRRSGPVLAANIWADFSYAAGNPVANYYAASPLTSAKLNSIDGIDIGPAPAAGLTKYVHKVLVMPASSTNIGITEWMLTMSACSTRSSTETVLSSSWFRLPYWTATMVLAVE